MTINDSEYYLATIDDIEINLKYLVKAKNEINYIEYELQKEQDVFVFMNHLINDDFDGPYIKMLEPIDLINFGFKREVNPVAKNMSRKRFRIYDKGEIVGRISLGDNRKVTILNANSYTMSEGIIKNAFQLYNELLRTRIIIEQ